MSNVLTRLFRNCFVLTALVLAAPTADGCDDEKLAKRPPPGENGVGPNGVHFENPPATSATSAPATISASVGTGGANITVTAPIPTP